jgi:hypothetical protein
LIEKIKNHPESIQFNEVIEYIDANYDFEPSAFKNGDTFNESGQNNGSCKLFAFGLLNKLTQNETLTCFGDYYRKDVLGHPNASDHQNIRNFIKFGWGGVEFKYVALKLKN